MTTYLPRPADLRAGKEPVREVLEPGMDGRAVYEIHLFVNAINPTPEDVEIFRQACAAVTRPGTNVKALVIELQVLHGMPPIVPPADVTPQTRMSPQSEATFVRVLQSSTYIGGGYAEVIEQAHTLAAQLDAELSTRSDARLSVARTKVECVGAKYQPRTEADAARMPGTYYEMHMRLELEAKDRDDAIAQMLSYAAHARWALELSHADRDYRYMVPVTLVEIDSKLDAPLQDGGKYKFFLNTRVHGGRERFDRVVATIRDAVVAAGADVAKVIQEFIAADFGIGEDVDAGILKETPEFAEYDYRMCSRPVANPTLLA